MALPISVFQNGNPTESVIYQVRKSSDGDWVIGHLKIEPNSDGSMGSVRITTVERFDKKSEAVSRAKALLVPSGGMSKDKYGAAIYDSEGNFQRFVPSEGYWEGINRIYFNEAKNRPKSDGVFEMM